jgi:hypothetical protein
MTTAEPCLVPLVLSSIPRVVPELYHNDETERSNEREHVVHVVEDHPRALTTTGRRVFLCPFKAFINLRIKLHFKSYTFNGHNDEEYHAFAELTKQIFGMSTQMRWQE